MTDILPAPRSRINLSTVELDLREIALIDMRVLVERHHPASPDGEVGFRHSGFSAGDAAEIERILIDRCVLDVDEEGAFRLRGLAVGAEDGDPVLDGVAGRDAGGRDGGGAD